jgi:hypothetical protein
MEELVRGARCFARFAGGPGLPDGPSEDEPSERAGRPQIEEPTVLFLPQLSPPGEDPLDAAGFAFALRRGLDFND